jgi:hypothetical protein
VIGTEQAVRSPAQSRGRGAEWAIKKQADVVDKSLPPAPRYAGRRSIGIEPSEAFGPGAGDTTLKFDNSRTLLVEIASWWGSVIGR